MKLSKALQGYWLVKRLEFSPNTVSFYKVAFRRVQKHQAILDLAANVKRMEENQRVKNSR